MRDNDQDVKQNTEEQNIQKTKRTSQKKPMKKENRIKLFACIAYIPLVWIVSFFAERKNQFVRFHIKQGMKLTVLTVVVGAVSWALNAFFSWVFSYSVQTPTQEDLAHITTGVNSVGQTLCIIVAFVATIILVAYALFGVIAACRGKMIDLPLLGKHKQEKTEETDDVT